MSRPPSGSSAVRMLLAALVVVLLAGTGAWGGAALAEGRAQQRTATAVLLVSPLEGNPFNPLGRGDDLLNLESEALLVRSDAVADAVIDRLGLATTSARLLEAVTVEVPPNTQLLRITTASPSVGGALDLADAFVEAFLDYRSGRSRSTRVDQVAALREQVAERSLDRDRLLVELAGLPASSPSAALLAQRVADLSAQIGVLRARRTELELGSTDPGQVVTPALIDPPEALARPELVAPAGALLGGAVAIAVLVGARRWWPHRSGRRSEATTPRRARGVPARPGIAAAALSLRVRLARRLSAAPGSTT